jgi:hypothetical protein
MVDKGLGAELGDFYWQVAATAGGHFVEALDGVVGQSWEHRCQVAPDRLPQPPTALNDREAKERITNGRKLDQIIRAGEQTGLAAAQIIRGK